MGLTLNLLLYDNFYIEKILKLFIAGIQAQFQIQVLLSFSVSNEEEFVSKIVKKP